MNLGGYLDGRIWAPLGARPEGSVDSSDPSTVLSARKQLWPILKSFGFTEFTDRLAHRVSKDFVEVVEVLPMDPSERKTWNHPAGLFRVGVGVYWPIIDEGNRFLRRNRKEEPRPRTIDCHISNWLVPDLHARKEARTAFSSIADVSTALIRQALAWLDDLRNPDSALSLLQRKDWELFWCYPMMRRYGASASSRRFVYIALLKYLLGENSEAERYLGRAEAAIHTWYREPFHERYEAWIGQVKKRICEPNNLSPVELKGEP